MVEGWPQAWNLNEFGRNYAAVAWRGGQEIFEV